jgi:anti-sigma B factor antagonist
VDTHAEAFAYEVTREGDHSVVVLSGDLDMATAPELSDCLNRLLHNGMSTVVVDVARLRFCDSSGLHVFVTSHRRAHDHGGAIVIRSPNETVQRLLTLTNLETVLGVDSNGGA